MLYRLSPSLILTAMLWTNDLSAGVSGFLPLPVRPPALDAKGVLPLSRASVHEAGHTAWAGSMESDIPDEEHAGSEARVHWDNELPGKPEKKELYWKDENGNLHRVRHGIVDGRPEQSSEQVASANSQGLNGVHNSVSTLLHRNGVMFVKHDSTGSVVLYTPPRNEGQDSVPGVVVVARVIGGGKALRSNSRIVRGAAIYELRKVSNSKTARSNLPPRRSHTKNSNGKSRACGSSISRVKGSGGVMKRKGRGIKKSLGVNVKDMMQGPLRELTSEVNGDHFCRSSEQSDLCDQPDPSLPCSDEVDDIAVPEQEADLWEVSQHTSLEALDVEARSMGLKDDFFTQGELAPELEQFGLFGQDWDFLVAFWEMLLGRALGSEDEYVRFTDLSAWLQKVFDLRERRGGRYTQLSDAFIDLCLQRMALIQARKQLYDNKHYFLTAEMNLYVQLQAYVENRPTATKASFREEEPELASVFDEETQSCSEEQLSEVRRELRIALKRSSGMMYLDFFSQPD